MTNLFTRFLKLLPQQPLRVGDVVSINNGVATIEEASGAKSTARGDANVGDHVFFRAGAIEGPAPDLPLVDVEV